MKKEEYRQKDAKKQISSQNAPNAQISPVQQQFQQSQNVPNAQISPTKQFLQISQNKQINTSPKKKIIDIISKEDLDKMQKIVDEINNKIPIPQFQIKKKVPIKYVM